MNTPSVCVSLDGTAVSEMLDEAAKSNIAGADLVEVCFDRLYLIPPEEDQAPAYEEEEGEPWGEIPVSDWSRKDADDVDYSACIEELKGGIAMPAIFTCRPTNEGGFYSGDEESRIAILRSAIESKVSYIDIEISIEEKERTKLIEYARENDVNVIVSAHVTEGVPSKDEIIEFVKQNKDLGDILKCCYTTESHLESLSMVEAAWEVSSEDLSYSLMGLGPGGDWTRIHAPLLNQSLVYSTLCNDFNLPELGLINVRDLKDAWVMLD